MQWHELFNHTQEPSDSEIEKFVAAPLWGDLDHYLRQTYNVQPKLFYSNCAMDKGMWKGWNAKYKKSGKSLCTLYPKQGYFLALMPVGIRDMDEAELLMPLCTAYTQTLFKQSVSGHHGKSLAFEVRDEGILNDMKRLIAIRGNPANKQNVSAQRHG